MYEKTQVIENKRHLFVKRQLEIENMDDGVLKKRLLYSQDTIMGNSSVNQEERELHEAYQFCIREYECRHKDIDLSSLSLSDSDTPSKSSKKKEKKKKDRRRSAEVCSMYRGKKSTYEKVAEAATAEEIYKELQTSDPIMITF